MSLSHTFGYRGCLRDSRVAPRHLVLMSCRKLFVHPGGMSRIIKSPFTGLVNDSIYHLVLAWQRAFSPLRAEGGWNCPGFAGSSPWLPFPLRVTWLCQRPSAHSQEGWGQGDTKKTIWEPLELYVLLLLGSKGWSFTLILFFLNALCLFGW